jgi:putative cardiolipin synthase
MGVLIDSPPLAEQLAGLMETDMRPDRSWRVGLDPAGALTWTSDRGTLTSQPARSYWQRIQDVLFGLAPKQWY